jgi:hypothetical protein
MKETGSIKPTRESEPQKSGKLKWQRIILLTVLAYEGLGCLLGGGLLIAQPNGSLMDMSVDLMNGVFRDFQIPGIILFGLGILNSSAFVIVLRRRPSDWFVSGLALAGLLIWFWVEIAILEELHWLHAMWGLPVVLGSLMIFSLLPNRERTIRKFLLMCGVISSIIYLTADIVSSFLWNGYSMRDQTVSELFAIDAPPRIIVILSFNLYAFFIYAFGIGLWKSSGTNRSIKIAGVFLIVKEIFGIAGTWFFPIHLRGIVGNYSDTMHGIITTVGVLCIALSMGFSSYALGKYFRIYSILTIIIFIICGILTGTYADELGQNLPTPGMGILERVNIYLFLLWVIVLSVIHIRKEKRLDFLSHFHD